MMAERPRRPTSAMTRSVVSAFSETAGWGRHGAPPERHEAERPFASGGHAYEAGPTERQESTRPYTSGSHAIGPGPMSAARRPSSARPSAPSPSLSTAAELNRHEYREAAYIINNLGRTMRDRVADLGRQAMRSTRRRVQPKVFVRPAPLPSSLLVLKRCADDISRFYDMGDLLRRAASRAGRVFVSAGTTYAPPGSTTPAAPREAVVVLTYAVPYLELTSDDPAEVARQHASLRAALEVLEAVNGLPGCLRLRDVFEETRKCVHVVMDAAPGGTLQALVAKNGPLPLRSAIGALRAVLTALLYAHRAGVAHGNLRPGCVMLMAPGPHVREEHVRLAGVCTAHVA